MSKRNFVLFIILLIIILIVGLWFFSAYKNPNGGEDGGGTNFWSKFNPFGSPAPTNNEKNLDGEVNIGESTDTTQGETVIPKLQKISSVPVAGFQIFNKERFKEEIIPAVSDTTPSTTSTKKTPPATEKVEAVRYVDRLSGNIYQTFLDKIEERRFSNTMIPKIYEAVFGNNDSTVLMRYLKSDDQTIETFSGIIPKEVLGADTNSNEIKGTFLPENITDFALSPDKNKIFYLTVDINDNATGNISALSDTTKKTAVFTSPFSEWLPDWPNVNLITLTTKPSAYALGYMYALNPTTKGFSRVLEGLPGLTTLTSPSGKTVLYADNGLLLNTFDMTKNTSKDLGLRTMPEKCVWGKNSDILYCAVPKNTPTELYPDAWYQGEVSFSDQIWKIDLTSGNNTLLVDPITEPGGEEIDGIKLAIDASGKYLFFVNKKDSYLWRLDLE